MYREQGLKLTIAGLSVTSENGQGSHNYWITVRAANVAEFN